MVRVIFARIGWMKWYRGPQADDPRPIGGGSYNKNEIGHEAYNFLKLNGYMLGYFQPANDPPTVALERIEAGVVGESLQGVLAVFVATDPKRGGQRIVGWFPGATVYRHKQKSNAEKRDFFSYFLKTPAEAAVLVPEERRLFDDVPSRGKGCFGQANIFYALDGKGHPKKDARWIDEALKYIASYDRENAAQEPESEVDPDIEEILGSTIERAAGFQSNPRIRRAIEEYAMRWAERRLKELLGQKPVDTHKTKSYDFLCKVSGGEVYVEVKGTQDNGTLVSLTPKEVEHARKHRNSALFIVHSVKVKGKRKPVVSGGTELFLYPWDISTGTLKPRGYVYTRKTEC